MRRGGVSARAFRSVAGMPVLRAGRVLRRALLRRRSDGRRALDPGLARGVPAPRWLDVDGLWCLAVAGCVVLARAAAYVALRRRRARRPDDVVLLGCSPVLVRLAGRLPQRPECGLRPVGFVS